MKFSSTSNTSVQRCPYILFQNQCPHFLLLHLFKRCLNSMVRINKKVNKHTFDYHPSPLELTSTIHPSIFWTPKGFFSPEYFLNFFLNLYISQWLQKSFKFMVIRLLKKTFVIQKVESIHFYSCP